MAARAQVDANIRPTRGPQSERQSVGMRGKRRESLESGSLPEGLMRVWTAPERGRESACAHSGTGPVKLIFQDLW